MALDSANIRRLLRRIRLRDLDTLTTVVRTGGMRKAALELHMSQPAVSKAIAELESAVGYPLLDRSRRGVEVTACGQALIRRSVSMFDELHRGMRELEDLTDPRGGQVETACTEPITAGIMATAVERMSQQFPRVVFGINSLHSPALLLQTLLDRKSDFVIARVYGAAIHPDVHAEPLFHENLKIVVGRNSPWAGRRKLTLAELADESWILSRNEITGASPVVAAFEAARVPFPQCKILSGSLNVRYTALATGRFVTVMPRSLLRFGAVRGSLKVLPVEIGSWGMPDMLLTLANHSLAPAARTLRDVVRDLARTMDR